MATQGPPFRHRPFPTHPMKLSPISPSGGFDRVHQAARAFLVAVALLGFRAIAAEGPPQAARGDRKPADASITGSEKAVLTQPPNVPPPITRKYATRVI